MINKDPKVSIVLVTYNRANELKEAIQQVLKQTYENIELLIGDDCSTDNTQEIIKSFNSSKIKNIRHEKNLGFFENWQTTLKYVEGEYFIPIICDDDRLVDFDFVKDGIKILEKDPTIDLVSAKYAAIIENKKVIEAYKDEIIKNSYDILKNFDKFQAHLCLSTMILHKKYLDLFINPNFEWDKTVVSNDQVLIYEVLLNSEKIYFLNKIVYHWVRKNENTFSNSNYGDIYEQIKSIYSLPNLLIPILKEKRQDELIDNFNKYFLNHFEAIKMCFHLHENNKIFKKLIEKNNLKNKKIYIFGCGEVGLKLFSYLQEKSFTDIIFIDDLRKSDNVIDLQSFSKSEDCFNEDTIVIIASYKMKIIHKIYKNLIKISKHKFKILELIEE